jgi:hypothetical protein
MRVSMPGTKEQGATTAASLFGVSKEAVSDDLLFVVYFCYLE